jgi:hypothetical protein
MSKKLSGILLLLILLVNLVVVISVEIDRRGEDGEGDEDLRAAEVEVEDDDKNGNEVIEDVKDEENEESEEKISDGGLFIDKAEAAETENYKAIEKSMANKLKMESTGRWIAADYAYGDITSAKWTVLEGDTLWEISEAKYGSGNNWTSILALNRNEIGFLPNQTQALIIEGQVLDLE